MPSPRRKTMARRGWSQHHIAVLRGGRDHYRCFSSWGYSPVPARIRDLMPPADEDARRRQAWSDLRDELLAECQPFRRPWAWWHFDSPEPRRRLRHDHAHQPWHDAPGLFFGLPVGLFNPMGSRPDEAAADFESQAEYLERLDLLTDRERELLAESPAPQSAAADAN